MLIVVVELVVLVVFLLRHCFLVQNVSNILAKLWQVILYEDWT